MTDTTIFRAITHLFERIDAEATNRSTLDGMQMLEDLMRAGDDPIMQARAEEVGGLIVVDVLRGFFATWYQRLQTIREAEIEREMLDAEAYWEEEGKYLDREQAEHDMLESRRGE